MALVRARDIGSSKCRILKMEKNKTYIIWLPDLLALYKRVHYDFNKIPDFAGMKRQHMDCFNQNWSNNPNDRGKGCPICAPIEKKWAEWREADKAKNKELKEKIKNQINKMVSERFFVAGINVEDPTEAFIGISFTQAKMTELKQIESTLEAKGLSIADIVLYYKYKEEPKKEYTLQEVADPRAKDLKARMQELMNRDYDHGGPPDLEKALIRTWDTIEKYKAAMNETGRSSDETPDEENHMVSAAAAAPIIEDGVISIDELDKPAASESATKVTGTSLDLDNLSLESLDSLEPVTPPKRVDITAAMYAAKFKDATWRNAVFALMAKYNRVVMDSDANAMHKKCYEALKKESLSVLETEATGLL